jgi:hypothetical protein
MIQEKARGRGKAREKVASPLRKTLQFFKNEAGKRKFQLSDKPEHQNKELFVGLNLEGNVIPFPCKSIECWVWHQFGQTH